MLISLNWISDFIKLNKSPKEIADKITLSLSEVEKIEQVGNDSILEIENKALTHRPDCFSHFGIAREIAAFFNLKFNNPLEKLNKTKFSIDGKSLPLKIKLLNNDFCKRYTAIVLSNIKVGESPKFIKERLENCGVRPINNIVDITNYVMLSLGQPIHAFDYQKVISKTIVVRTAKKNENIITLDNVKRKLVQPPFDRSQQILVIADAKKPIALAGIMGGKNSEIDNKTTSIIIESANFDAKTIRKSARMLNLRTEASSRFEKNIDPYLTKSALIYAVVLLKKYAAAQTSSEIIDLYPQREQTKEIITSVSYLNTLLGLDLQHTKIIELLNRLGIKAQQKNNKLFVRPAVLRRDLNIPADVAEEVARIYGYDNIPTTLPRGIITPPPTNQSLYWEEKTKLVFRGFGFTEVNLPNFIGRDVIELTKENPSDYLKLVNPMSPNKTYLRRSLLQGLFAASKANARFFKAFSIFEIGRVFLKTEKDKQPQEIKMLSGIMLGKSFYEVKGVIEALFEFWKIPFPKVTPLLKTAIFLPKVSARIDNFGFFGELNTTIKNYIGEKNHISAFELNFDQVTAAAKKDNYYQQIPLYPALIEDFSFIFTKNPPIGDVLAAIKNINSLISEVIVLSKFEKTITFRISFQDPHKPLSSEKILPIRKEIVMKLKNNFGAKIKE